MKREFVTLIPETEVRRIANRAFWKGVGWSYIGLLIGAILARMF